jgi:hypothetical protein
MLSCCKRWAVFPAFLEETASGFSHPSNQSYGLKFWACVLDWLRRRNSYYCFSVILTSGRDLVWCRYSL